MELVATSDIEAAVRVAVGYGTRYAGYARTRCGFALLAFIAGLAFVHRRNP